MKKEISTKEYLEKGNYGVDKLSNTELVNMLFSWSTIIDNNWDNEYTDRLCEINQKVSNEFINRRLKLKYTA